MFRITENLFRLSALYMVGALGTLAAVAAYSSMRNDSQPKAARPQARTVIKVRPQREEGETALGLARLPKPALADLPEPRKIESSNEHPSIIGFRIPETIFTKAEPIEIRTESDEVSEHISTLEAKDDKPATFKFGDHARSIAEARTPSKPTGKRAA